MNRLVLTLIFLTALNQSPSVSAFVFARSRSTHHFALHADSSVTNYITASLNTISVLAKEQDMIKLKSFAREQLVILDGELKLTKSRVESTKELLAAEETYSSDLSSLFELLDYQRLILSGQLSAQRAKCQGEVNLRPILEYSIVRWYERRHPFEKCTPSHAFTVTSMLSDNKPQYDKDRRRLSRAIEKALNLRQLSDIQAKDIEHEFSKIWHALSSDFLEIDFDMDRTGFIVGRDAFLSIGASAMLMFFDLAHTTMTEDYTEVQYVYEEGDIYF